MIFQQNVDRCSAYVRRCKLVFVKHVDFMNLCSVTFKVHEAFECKLHTFIVEE